MTVLYWLLSDSCRYKVFVGTRVAEIQELTKGQEWHYVDSQNNPADDLTRGKLLSDLSRPCSWNKGPAFLFQSLELWPSNPNIDQSDDSVELRKPNFCGVVFLNHTPLSLTPVNLLPSKTSLTVWLPPFMGRQILHQQKTTVMQRRQS